MRKASLGLVAVVLAAGCSTSTTSNAIPTASPGTKVRPLMQFTPGALNPSVTQETISQTICVSGWTKTIRPPASFTDALKVKQLREEYRNSDQNPQDYEEDHLIPLELGGAPADPNNLWPEPHPSSFAKDKEENRLHAAVCSGKMSLTVARSTILTDWGPR